MKYLLYILAFFLVGCADYDYKITKMPSRTLTYKQLPAKLQKCLSDYDSHLIHSTDDILLCDNNDSNRYQCEAVHPVLGSKAWIDYIKLIDTSNNIVYRIELETPHPYIIYKDKLYVPDNFYAYIDGFTDCIYSVYDLKQN